MIDGGGHEWLITTTNDHFNLNAIASIFPLHLPCFPLVTCFLPSSQPLSLSIQRSAAMDADNDEPLPQQPDMDKETPDDDNNQEPENTSPKPTSSDADETKEDSAHHHEEFHVPPLPPDLNQISQDVDHFISSLHLEQDADNPLDLPNFLSQFLGLFEAKIESYEVDDALKWSALSEEESAAFLQDVDRTSSLSRALLKFSTCQKYASPINRTGRVLQRAMSYAEEQFKLILEDPKRHGYSDHNQPSTESKDESSDETPQPDPDESSPTSAKASTIAPPEEVTIAGYSEKVVSYLVKLAKVLIAGGHEAECCHVYLIARRNALEENLQMVGFEKHSIDDVHKMQWESLEREIQNWIGAFKQWATADVSGERKLFETVFSDNLSESESESESLFGSLFYGVTIQLLNFSAAIALTKRATEKLFKFLDIYETLRDNLTVIDHLITGELRTVLKTEASIIRSRLGETMVMIFRDLENSIKADSGKTPVPGGAVHPLTKYTMNYLGYACEYQATLVQVFREHHEVGRGDSVHGSEVNINEQTQNADTTECPFQAQMVKIMEILDANIEGKSKLYKDPALSAIFMMNNGRYILKKIKVSGEMKNLIGEPWYRKKSSDLRVYHKDYQRETWGKLLGCFPSEGLVINGKVSKPVLKERFKSFNAMFDEIHKTQSTWVVADEQLQSELRVSISNMVIPAYRSFLGRYGPVFTPGRQTEKYVKFQADDIENYIEELFDGGVAGRKKL